MRHRALAGAAVVGWSKAAVATPLLPGAAEQPAAAAQTAVQPSVAPSTTPCSQAIEGPPANSTSTSRSMR